MNDTRAEAYRLLHDTLLICEFHKCGIDCEHVPTLRKVGEILEADTALKRKQKYGEVVVKEQYKQIDRTIKVEKKGKNPYLTIEHMKEQIKKGLTNEQIIQKYSFNKNTFYSFMTKHGLENPNRWRQKYDITKEDLEKQIAEGKTNKQIAYHFGMKHQDSIKLRLEKFGLTNPNMAKRKGWKYES